jgi:hypothetical protein
MRALPRLSLCLAACVALLAGFGYAFARWGGVSLGDWDLSAVGRVLLTETRREQDLQARDADCLRRLAAKHEVTEALLAGRLSLRRAAELFRQIDEDAGGAVAAGTDGDDAAYDNVLAWAETALSDRPGSADELARLRAERSAALAPR